jgi:hypothetical protein
VQQRLLKETSDMIAQSKKQPQTGASATNN